MKATLLACLTALTMAMPSYALAEDEVEIIDAKTSHEYMLDLPTKFEDQTPCMEATVVYEKFHRELEYIQAKAEQLVELEDVDSDKSHTALIHMMPEVFAKQFDTARWGIKPKDLIKTSTAVAFLLNADGRDQLPDEDSDDKYVSPYKIGVIKCEEYHGRYEVSDAAINYIKDTYGLRKHIDLKDFFLVSTDGKMMLLNSAGEVTEVKNMPAKLKAKLENVLSSEM